MDWKDTLLPGATRTSYAPGTQPADTSGLGWRLDLYGQPQERNDWVMGPGGHPMISGEGPNPEAGAVPSPGYYPIGSGGPPVNVALPPAAMQAFYGLPVGQQQQFAGAANAPAQTAVAQQALASSDLTNYQDLYRQILKALGAG